MHDESQKSITQIRDIIEDEKKRRRSVAGVFAGTASDECIRGFVVMWYWWKRKWTGKAIVK